MNIQTYLTTVGAAALSLVAYAGCTVNSTTNNNGTDGGTEMDSSTGAVDDSGTDTGSVADTGTTPVDSGATPDASDGAVACSVALDTGSADCNTCVDSSCCTPLTTCVAPDDAGTDDAGNSACLQLLFCINDINNSSDAGVDSGAGETACNSSYSASEQAAAQGVLSCIRTNCSAQCPGL